MSDLFWKVKESKKIIKAANKKWWPNIGMAFTGHKDSTVMAHLIKSVNKKMPVAMFIDHGMHFSQTHQHLEKLSKLWKITTISVTENKLFKKIEEETKLESKKDLSRELKIASIKETVRKYKWQALYVAIRKDENSARSGERYFSKRKGHYRIHPILHFTENNIWNYIEKHQIPYNPIYDKGYRSLGEKHFTKKVKDKSKDERSGREKDKEKVMKMLRSLGYF